MNLYGLEPQDHVGKIYRLSIWLWHPLWNYIEKEYPEVADMVGNGHANNGDIVSKENAKKIFDLITKDLANEKIIKYINEFNSFLESLPEVTCEYCLGFGKEREYILNITNEDCFRCNGSGKSKMFITNYKADLYDFYKFKEFLENCGGFKIL